MRAHGYHCRHGRERSSGGASEDDVIEALEEVIDPELGLDFVSLGLVYDVEIEDTDVYVTFTLTTPACPIGPQVSEQMQRVRRRPPGRQRRPPEDGLRPALVPGDDVRGRQVRARVLRGFGKRITGAPSRAWTPICKRIANPDDHGGLASASVKAVWYSRPSCATRVSQDSFRGNQRRSRSSGRSARLGLAGMGDVVDPRFQRLLDPLADAAVEVREDPLSTLAVSRFVDRVAGN